MSGGSSERQFVNLLRFDNNQKRRRQEKISQRPADGSIDDKTKLPIELDLESKNIPLVESSEKTSGEVELNTILIDDGKGGTFEEAKKRLHRVFELRQDPWYSKLLNLFAKHQDKYEGEEFLIPVDCPDEVGEQFIKDMLQTANEQGLEGEGRMESGVILRSDQPTGDRKLTKASEVTVVTALNVKDYQPEVSKINEEFVNTNKKDRSAFEVKQNREGGNWIEKTPAFKYLENLYIQGMEPYDMRRLLLTQKGEKITEKLNNLALQYQDFAQLRPKIVERNWDKIVEFFINKLNRGRGGKRGEGYDPAQEFLTRAVIEQPTFEYNQLNAKDIKESNQKFIEATREVWQDFVYSGSWEYSKEKGWQPKKETDLDAKISLFLFKQAGILGALNAEPVAPGHYREGVTNIDTGGVGGVRLHKEKGKTTIFLDNHSRGRTLVETSSAKIIYRLLTASGFIDKNNQALRVLTEIATDDDHGNLIVNHQQFKNAGTNLRGLVKYFSDTDSLYRHVNEVWPTVGGNEIKKEDNWPIREKSWQEVYRRLLDKKLNSDEIKKFSLARGQSKLFERFRFAEKILKKKTEELKADGRVIDTKYGQYLVSVAGWWPKGEQYLAGHEGAKAYGYDGVLIYDPFKDEFKVNSVKREVDLSKDWKLPQGTAVRGKMVLSKGSPLRVNLKEILHQVAPGEVESAQGYLKEFLDLETKVDQILADQKTEILDHCRQLYQTWPAEAKVQGEPEQQRDIRNIYQETLSEARKGIYNKYIENRQPVVK